jgi:hypothetical protein
LVVSDGGLTVFLNFSVGGVEAPEDSANTVFFFVRGTLEEFGPLVLSKQGIESTKGSLDLEDDHSMGLAMHWLSLGLNRSKE